MDRSNAIETITEIGRSGAPFLHFVVAALPAQEPLFETELIEALKSIGTAEAVAALKKTAESTDWVWRSQATAALRELRDSAETGDK